MDTRGPSHFTPDGDASTVSVNWDAWLEEFEAFADSKGLFNLAGEDNANMRAQRKALLLYHAGPRVREIHSTLDQTQRDQYTEMVAVLQGHFHIAPNITYQRHMFRQCIQKETETISQYCARLRKLATHCDYGDAQAVNNQIRDQIVEGCTADKLREKLLEEGNALTLQILLTRSATHEAVVQRSREMNNASAINRVASGSTARKPSFTQETEGANVCPRCNLTHKPRECPAYGKQCRKCDGMNHYARCCQNKAKQNGQGANAGYYRSRRANNVNVGDHQQASPETVNNNSESPEFVFNSYHVPLVCNSNSLDRVNVYVGGVSARFIIESGSECNVMSRDTYERLRASKFIIKRFISGGPKILPYTAKEPIQPVGRVWCDLQLHNNTAVLEDVAFTVIPNKGESLLGNETGKQLGVIRIINRVGLDDYEARYPRLFSEVLGKSKNEIKLTIRDDIAPVAQPFRRVPLLLRDKLAAHLDELIAHDIIEKVEGHSGSSWVSPAVIIPKKESGKIRLCIDMRRANEAIVRHQHPVPTVDEMLYDMNGAQYFSKLDMRMGFHQFVLHPESRDITTFSTHLGLYRYKRLMFGINAAPEIYQKEVAKIIQGLPGVANLADDIIVHAKTREEHDRRLGEVFSRLEQANMTLNKKKCEIGVQQLEFLGHLLSYKGIDPHGCKVKAVKDAAVPKTVGELKSFLGLTSYMSKFIPHYSHTTDVLRRLSAGKNSREAICLSDKEIVAFNQLKADLCNHDTLTHFDTSCETLLYTDASPVGLGAILVQIQNGEPKVVSYGSRALSDVEKRYMQTEKEALGIVWACERFHHYLFGCRFKVVSDCEPLESIYGNKTKRTSLRIERWQLRLQSYDFEIVRVKSSDNIADPLSRLLCSKKATEHLVERENVELYVRSVVEDNVPSAITPRYIEEVSYMDEEIKALKQAIRANSFDNVDIPAVYRAIKNELCVIGELVLRGGRIVVPQELRQKMLEIAHEGHSGMGGTKRYLRTRVWWPGIDSDVDKYVKHCHDCQLTSKPLDRQPVRVTELPNGPWEDLALDFLGPLSNGKSVLVLTDYYSRWNEVKFMTVTKASDVISWLKSVFFTHGYPLSMKSDNGPQFISHEYGEFCSGYGIEQCLTTPRWPEANGQVERQNRSIMKRIQIAHNNRVDYESALMTWLFTYRNTPHSITGKSPAEMLFGRVLRTNLPSLPNSFDDVEARDRDSEMKHKMIATRNEKLETGSGNNHQLEIGSFVLVKRDSPSKCQTLFHPDPFVVMDIKGSQITVKSRAGRLYKRNISHVRPYYCSEKPVVDADVDSETQGALVATRPSQMIPIIPRSENDTETVTDRPVQVTPPTVPPALVEIEDIPQAANMPSSSQPNVPTPRKSVRAKNRPAKYDGFVTEYHT